LQRRGIRSVTASPRGWRPTTISRDALVYKSLRWAYQPVKHTIPLLRELSALPRPEEGHQRVPGVRRLRGPADRVGELKANAERYITASGVVGQALGEPDTGVAGTARPGELQGPGLTRVTAPPLTGVTLPVEVTLGVAQLAVEPGAVRPRRRGGPRRRLRARHDRLLGWWHEPDLRAGLARSGMGCPLGRLPHRAVHELRSPLLLRLSADVLHDLCSIPGLRRWRGLVALGARVARVRHDYAPAVSAAALPAVPGLAMAARTGLEVTTGVPPGGRPAVPGVRRGLVPRAGRGRVRPPPCRRGSESAVRRNVGGVDPPRCPDAA
jgi:hypothetical protein